MGHTVTDRQGMCAEGEESGSHRGKRQRWPMSVSAGRSGDGGISAVRGSLWTARMGGAGMAEAGN